MTQRWTIKTFLVLAMLSPLTAQDRPGVALPTPTGPYSVGTVTHHWVQSNAVEELTEDPNDLRQVIAQLWYPTDEAIDGATASYFPEVRAIQAALESDRRRELQGMARAFDAHAEVQTSSLRGAAVLPGESLPVVLFSPGGNMSRHWHSGLAQEIASHGYVVLAMSHAHSGMDFFPRGGLLMSHDRWRGTRGESEDDALLRDEELSDVLAGDARFAIDQLERLQEADPKERFTGRLDLSRIAILGHSRGGKTVARLCSSDDRVKSCVVYDNVGPQTEREIGLEQPMMTIRSDASRDWDPERIAALESYLAANANESYEVIIRGAGHHSFTDLPFVEPARFATAIDAARAHRIVAALTLGFLDRTLNKSDQEIAERAAEFEEVILKKHG